jgi:hypothetical protein
VKAVYARHPLVVEAVAETRSVRRGDDDLAMAQNFIECDREQAFLMLHRCASGYPRTTSRGS